MLLAKSVTVLEKHPDFANVFLKKPAEVLLKQMKINKHTIKLDDSIQPFYYPIYSLGQVKLENVKTFIEKNLANSFI